MTEREHYGITAAVWVGSLVLVGVPTMALVSTVIGAVFSATTLPQSPVVQLGIGILAVAVGLTVTTELTRVRLHGFNEFHRGSPARSLLRHAILAVPVVFVVGYLGYLVVTVAVHVRDRGGDWFVLVAFGATFATFVFLVVRIVQSFRVGRTEGAGSAPTSDAE